MFSNSSKPLVRQGRSCCRFQPNSFRKGRSERIHAKMRSLAPNIPCFSHKCSIMVKQAFPNLSKPWVRQGVSGGRYPPNPFRTSKVVPNELMPKSGVWLPCIACSSQECSMILKGVFHKFSEPLVRQDVTCCSYHPNSFRTIMVVPNEFKPKSGVRLPACAAVRRNGLSC
jgi:hypothetical protein